MSITNHAAVLYGNAAPIHNEPAPIANAPAKENAPSAPQQQADAGASPSAALYGEPKQPTAAEQAEREAEETHKNLRATEEAEQAETARLNSTYGSSATLISEQSVNRLGLSPTDAEQVAGTWVKVFDEFRVSSDDAGYLSELGVSAAANGVDDETHLSWKKAAYSALQTEFGDTQDLAMRDANALLGRHPRLLKQLLDSKLASHPKVVIAIARHARNLRLNGGGRL